ncbi:MAG: NAD-dependent epimerase/dehydratase family protein [Candidatus Odinarchaeota archaeon]|nr:NAD-dependent epimerase/dehydratase family protein [Candidatus Odinarchaeota archaeon]
MKHLSMLVTGACGFVGSHMVDLLLSMGHYVRAMDKYLCSEIISNNVEFIRADLTKKETLTTLFEDIDYAFHIAALFDYSASWRELYKVNVEGTKNLCEEALNSGVKRVVIWSSGAIYGIPKKVPVKEDAPLAPLNDYEKSKAEQEKIALKYYEENGLPITILRPASVYGPRGKYGVSVILFLLAEGKLPAIPGPGKFRPALVHVKDVVNAAYFVCEKMNAVGEVYNISDDGRYTIEELILAAADMIGVKIHKFHIPAPILYIVAMLNSIYSKITKKKPLITKEMIRYLTYDSIMDNTKIKELGYKLLYPDTLVGLRETIEWYKQVGWI